MRPSDQKQLSLKRQSVIVLKKRDMPLHGSEGEMGTWKSSRVGQGSEGARENVAKSLCYGSWGKKWARQGIKV